MKMNQFSRKCFLKTSHLKKKEKKKKKKPFSKCIDVLVVNTNTNEIKNDYIIYPLEQK